MVQEVLRDASVKIRFASRISSRKRTSKLRRFRTEDVLVPCRHVGLGRSSPIVKTLISRVRLVPTCAG